MKKLKKGCIFTDIHFGRKSNSPQHNQDCLDFLQFMCNHIKTDKSIDYVAFLGDWHESRTALDVSTQNYSYRGAKMLNDIGIPVFFLVGNHDLGTRDSRNLYTTIPFHEFDNFTLIHEKPLVVDTIEGGCMFAPYLMHDEYGSLHEYDDIPVWMGHFEFKGFVLTGYNTKLEYGPDVSSFTKPTHILSGHFHRRQQQNNVVYIGNTFPMDFGDANIHDRGFVVYDHSDNSIEYTDWTECPKYIKCKLSQLLDDSVTLLDNSYVFVDVDIPIDYEELSVIEKAYNSKYNLRELKLDETSKFLDSLVNEDIDEDDCEDDRKSTDELIFELLKQVDDSKFDTQLLQQMYMQAGMSNKHE